MANKIEKGMIWEAVPGEPMHYYLILSADEVIRLKRICDGRIAERYRGQVRDFGITRKAK
jgi:hypothetical protein